MFDLNPQPFDSRISYILSNYQAFGLDLWEQLFGLLARCVDSLPSWDSLQASSDDERMRIFLSYWHDLPGRARWMAIYLIGHALEKR